MANASKDRSGELQYMLDELKLAYKRFEESEQVDKLGLLHMIMLIHQTFEIVAEMVRDE